MKNLLFITLLFIICSCHKKDEVPDYSTKLVGTYAGNNDYDYNGNPMDYTGVTVTIIRTGENQIQASGVKFSAGPLVFTIVEVRGGYQLTPFGQTTAYGYTYGDSVLVINGLPNQGIFGGLKN